MRTPRMRSTIRKMITIDWGSTDLFLTNHIAKSNTDLQANRLITRQRRPRILSAAQPDRPLVALRSVRRDRRQSRDQDDEESSRCDDRLRGFAGNCRCEFF